VKTLMYEMMNRLILRIQVLALLSLAVVIVGCEADSFLDPSKTGYFEHTPTSMPILKRIDIIEREVGFAPSMTKPVPEDLVPNRLEYRLAPGDVVRVEIYELVIANQTDLSVRVIDQSGVIRLPTLGDVQAANLTVQQLQDEIINRLKDLIRDPIVTVVLEDGRSFQFTIYGAVAGTGIYQLTRPDFRVMDAISMAGGTAATTQHVFVIREVALDDAVNPTFEKGSSTTPKAGNPVKNDDIDRLIEELDGPSNQDPAPSPGARGGGFADDPPIDVDDLSGAPTSTPAIQTASPAGNASNGPAFHFDEATQSWVRGSGTQTPTRTGIPAALAPEPTPTQSGSFLTRIIEIDYPALSTGDSNLNVVIRPGDRIYVATPEIGVVYIDGEISRPGVFSLPISGRLTLSRLVAAAGGLNGLAIPERVDLIRKIGPDRESAIRVNLAAIRNRAEPDIYMRRDDHVIIGTNFYATPLAIVRNGFRMTYGFGFLLDRNFGNDVFGAPPTNFVSR
jgi:polysaccharide export outer membrane protein